MVKGLGIGKVITRYGNTNCMVVGKGQSPLALCLLQGKFVERRIICHYFAFDPPYFKVGRNISNVEKHDTDISRKREKNENAGMDK